MYGVITRPTTLTIYIHFSHAGLHHEVLNVLRMAKGVQEVEDLANTALKITCMWRYDLKLLEKVNALSSVEKTDPVLPAPNSFIVF